MHPLLDPNWRRGHPALSNALDALRLRPHNVGDTDGSVDRITGAAPMAGRAVTAKMVAREPGEDGIRVSHLHKAIAEMDGPVMVALQDCDEPAGAGAFLGEVNGSLPAALGIRGLVTNGRVRDVDELRRFPYSVHAAGLCFARSYMRLIDVGTEGHGRRHDGAAGRHPARRRARGAADSRPMPCPASSRTPRSSVRTSRTWPAGRVRTISASRSDCNSAGSGTERVLPRCSATRRRHR